MSYAEIALLEPLSVCLHATAKAELRLGQPVLITGAGPIGIVQLLCASASGCSPIVITDLSKERLDFAKKVVPDVHPFLIDLLKTPEETATEIIKTFTYACSGVGGTGLNGEVMPAVSMECTGQESSIATAACESKRRHSSTMSPFTNPAEFPDATQPSGLVFVIGVGKSHINLPFMHLSTNEIALKFLFRYRDTWPREYCHS